MAKRLPAAPTISGPKSAPVDTEALVKMITDQKLSVAEAARRLDVGENLLREWRKAFLARGDAAFPGHGNPTPADDEVQRMLLPQWISPHWSDHREN